MAINGLEGDVPLSVETRLSGVADHGDDAAFWSVSRFLL